VLEFVQRSAHAYTAGAHAPKASRDTGNDPQTIPDTPRSHRTR